MKNYTKLRIFLLENGIKNKEVAKLLEIDDSTFSRKISKKTKTDFNLDEVRKICDNYKIDPKKYFFI